MLGHGAPDASGGRHWVRPTPQGGRLLGPSVKQIRTHGVVASRAARLVRHAYTAPCTAAGTAQSQLTCDAVTSRRTKTRSRKAGRAASPASAASASLLATAQGACHSTTCEKPK